MSEAIITVPKSLGFEETLRFLEVLRCQPSEGKLEFDFSNLSYVGPFGFVMISAAAKDLVGRAAPGSVFVRNHTHLHYHAHMGFFQAFGVDFGNAPGEAKGSGRYIPITIQDVVAIQREAVLSGIAVGAVVEEHAKRLAVVLAREESGDLHDTFTYSLREIIRNVAEHSQSRIVEYCAQYWPTQDRAELVILDRGVGIHRTLLNNPYLEIENEQHALNLSLLPGVSGKSFQGAKLREKDGWQNSGYGLYMTSRMCRNGGKFFIGSCGASVFLEDAQKHYIPFNYPGTVVRMVFKPSKIGRVKEALATYNADGIEIAKSIKGTIITASSASRMLSNDFKA